MVSRNTTFEFLSWICRSLRNNSNPANEDFFGDKLPKTENTSDNGAVIYIISVLIFYSAAIVVMIIKYLNSEKQEKNEEAVLEAFFQNMPTMKAEKENQVNQVAIRAFHTLTSAIHDEDSLISSPQLLVTDV